MIFTIVENVRGYFGSRPPLVAFMIFLASMAVGLITFAYCVSDMPRTVADQEFTKFMERLSALNLCVGEEQGASALANISQSAVMGSGRTSYVERMKQAENRVIRDQPAEQAASVMTIPPSSPTTGNFIVNVSMEVTLEIAATAIFQNIAAAYNTTIITTTVWASQMGRAGHGQDMEANVTMRILPFGNRSHPCRYGQPGQCYIVGGCMTITAPRHFFPHTLNWDVSERCQRINPEVWGENHLHGEVAVGYRRCANATAVHLQHILGSNHHGVVFVPDRSAVNLHLMHSSYFLFVMVISLFCYAIIRGRPAKVKVIHMQSTSDKHALIQV